jgi:hypothetical protein
MNLSLRQVCAVLALSSIASMCPNLASADSGKPNDMTALRAAKMAAPSPPMNAHEVGQAMGYLDKNRLALFDTNGDGRFDSDEWLEMTFAAYLVYSSSDDPKVTLDQFAQRWLGPKDHPYKTAHPTMDWVKARFQKLDKGGKGYLTAVDFREESSQYFRANDLDHDGFVTEDEIRRAARGAVP